MVKQFNLMQIEALKSAYALNEKITIEGINGIGQPFKVTGNIAPTMRKEIGCVFKDGVELEFGDGYIHGEYTLNFKYSKEGNSVCDLVIEKITNKNGNVVYENNDQEIYEQCKKNKEKYFKENSKLREYDSATWKMFWKLLEMVGKPVVINNYRSHYIKGCSQGVFYGISGIDSNGNITVMLCGDWVQRAEVNEQTFLFTVNDEGDFVKLEDNMKDEKTSYKALDLFNLNRERCKECDEKREEKE